MISRAIFSLVFFSVLLSCGAQEDFGKLTYKTALPDLLKETSGIAYNEQDQSVYTINDSGHGPIIYNITPKTGKINKAITLQKAANIDWEDITADEDHIYIGDFGNNGNYRKDLAIYTVSKVDIEDGNAFAKASKISFSYSDQTEFPPKKSERNFDVEAFFLLNDHFYLFTRNREKNYDGTTTCYKLPNKEGIHVAERIHSFPTCDDQTDCLITSAAIHKPSGKIALLSYNKVWILSNYEGDDFFSGTVEKIKLGHRSQKEGITFKDENTLLIADEGSKRHSSTIYELTMD